ncbi:glycoside hydrolase family 16 protein [Hypoxylon sp. CI-4A]|nr:glycoside hydrolase family 16 protein [Hypoxylon sp. CI-4A]
MDVGYSLANHYGGQGLLDSFSFFTGNDPSNGFVDYQSKEDAVAKNLVSVDHDYGSVRLGVDSNNTYTTSDKGRPSVRLTSQDAFTHGLFIADIYHMPSSTCGTWPAFWAFNNQDDGSQWPAGGEVEIIEGANTAQRNLFSAHTTEGCSAPSDGFSGRQGRTDCSPGSDNVGCNYASPSSDTTSYGDSFNAEGGGVYALEWDSQDLKIWHFPRSTIPDNIVYAHVEGPDPSSWGPPQAIFGSSSCSPDNYFFNLSLVFNINFCGDYAGNVWGKADRCNQLAPTCEEFVAGNPNSFQEAYWDINFVDVYQYSPLTNMTIPPASPKNTSSAISSSISNPTPAPSGVTPTHTRTITLSTVQPTATDGSSVDPATINGHTLLGCFGPSADSFTQAASSPDMDNAACVSACAGHVYSGVHDDTCYCGDSLNDAAAVENAMCDRQCPGNGHQVCGGRVDPSKLRNQFNWMVNPTSTGGSSELQGREAPSAMLLTVYSNPALEPALPGAPAMGGEFVKTIKPNTAIKAPVTVTYTTVCSTNPASLVEAKYTTTVTYQKCGCAKSKHNHKLTQYPTSFTSQTSPAQTAVPMTTYTEKCQACGPHGESTVTLTLPVAVHTKKIVVTSVAVHTVIPIHANATTTAVAVTAVNTLTTHAAPSYGTAVPYTPGSVPGPGGANVAPAPLVAGASPRGRVATVMQTLGWGVAVWFGLFGAMLVL